MVFLREHNDIVLTSDTSTIFLCTIRYSYKCASNDWHETTIDLEYNPKTIITMNYVPSNL